MDSALPFDPGQNQKQDHPIGGGDVAVISAIALNPKLLPGIFGIDAKKVIAIVKSTINSMPCRSKLTQANGAGPTEVDLF